ncbi:zinc-binding protein A33-like [Takifugu rubripes]|uniref:Zinc-binding protein A33-like n=1 Tax=Takifugu rubripes TaxID=31033 RepID=H2UQH4_TAKRU|nr:zinc-binding protein A33-like [Takifugu rubripes]|eukprot:XP_003967633.1 PREDICTED: zinc-binding protein A33-like [Takifugu rubripes]
MATRLCEDDLLCPQCSDIYCLPVLLQCGHNICKVCLHKFWELKACRECPVCRAISIPERPPINLALKIAAEEYQGQRTSRDQGICLLHEHKLTIFCQNDEEPICLVCQTSKRHKVHECCPVVEASRQKKKEMAALLETLKKQLRKLNKTKEEWEETRTYIQNQAAENEEAIREEFDKLHKFLVEEERHRLKVLRQEEEVKKQVMSEKLKTLTEEIQNLSANVGDIEMALKEKDLPFLMGYKQTKKRAKCNIHEPECIRDILINSAKHLGSLKFGVWNKMATHVKCVPFVLDPNTAQSNLEFSEELTRVQYCRKRLLPDNPERCTSRVCVLGATGFTSGKHSWTVDVGQGQDWYIGAAGESIKRKNAVFLNPTEGFWVIGLCNGDTFWAQTSPRVKLVLKQKPGRITVKLDFDKGKVVFINAEDSTTIHTFNDRFVEKIYPYFSPGLYKDGKSSSPLTVCPRKITVNVE